MFTAGDVHAGTDEAYLFGRLRVSGPDPDHRSYRSYASFSDPDATAGSCRRSPNDCPDAWTRTPRHSPRQLSSRPRSAVRRPCTASTRKRTGQHDADWPDWYAEYMVAEQAGKGPAS